MNLTDEMKREIMREMGRKGGKANTRANLVKAGKKSAELRRLKKLESLAKNSPKLLSS